MKFFTTIVSAAVASTSFIAVNPAESSQSFHETCTIKRISTGETTYQRCNITGARMLDGRHQVIHIQLENGNAYEKDGRMWDYHGPDCLGNSRDYIICR